jgi:hypothetical protein
MEKENGDCAPKMDVRDGAQLQRTMKKSNGKAERLSETTFQPLFPSNAQND